MSRSTLFDNIMFGPNIQERLTTAINVQTLAGTYTLDKSSAPVQFIDPGGVTRSFIMPLETASRGLIFFIVNKSTGVFELTIRNNANAVTVGVIGQNEMAMLVCDGTTWSIGVGTTT